MRNIQTDAVNLIAGPCDKHAGNKTAPANAYATRPEATLSVTRGVCRYLLDSGYAPLTEFTLISGRRADIAAVGRKGEIVMVEVKSCQADFAVDQKWTDYVGFCDQFFFAVGPDFPREILPDHQGLIIADTYGASIWRESQALTLPAARRKAVTIRIARQALLRRMSDTFSHV